MLSSIINLFFPKVCHACASFLSDNEYTVCISCRHNLPVTNFHFNKDDTVAKTLRGRVKIESGTALFRYEKKGPVQQLIHNLKYKGHEHLGELLGDWLGGELKTIAAYKNIDTVIPVPMHEKKLKRRGYNQVTKFGQQIALALDAPFIDDALVKITNSVSQTKKSRVARWSKDDELFALKNISKIEGKHILLVDDIITTGATLEACCSVLNQAKNIKISIATMAIA